VAGYEVGCCGGYFGEDLGEDSLLDGEGEVGWVEGGEVVVFYVDGLVFGRHSGSGFGGPVRF